MNLEALAQASEIVLKALLSTYSPQVANSYPQIPQQVVDIAHWEVWPKNCEALMWLV